MIVPRPPRHLASLLAAAVLAACGQGTRWERPLPAGLQPLPEAFRLEYTAIHTPEDRVLRTPDEVRALERRARYAPDPLPLPEDGRVIAASAAGQGRSGDPSISFAGYRVQGDTVTVYVTLVRPHSAECPVPDDVTAVVIGGFVPAVAHVRFERIEGRRRC